MQYLVCLQLPLMVLGFRTENGLTFFFNMDSWYMGGGSYAGLLGVNVIGTALCWYSLLPALNMHHLVVVVV